MAKLLVADDERMIGLALKRVLEKSGHSVALASNGIEAVGLCKSETFDLCMIDLLMPEMGGAELLDWIVGQGKPMKIIVMTAYGDQNLQASLLQKGASAVLRKPFDDILQIPALVARELGQ